MKKNFGEQKNYREICKICSVPETLKKNYRYTKLQNQIFREFREKHRRKSGKIFLSKLEKV